MNARLLLTYYWPEFILMSCLNARELRKKEKVLIFWGAGGHLVENRWNESPVCSVLFSLLLLPWPGLSFLLTRCGWMCQSQKLPRAFDLPQQSRKLFLCLQPGFSIQKWKEKFSGTRRDVSRYVQGSSGELRPMCLKRQKWWGEVEVGLSWVQSPPMQSWSQ